MRWVFNLGYLLVAAAIWPWFVYKAITTGKYRAGLAQRLGRVAPREGGRTIWVHAVSVGELLQVRPLLKALRERHSRYEIVVTYTTKTAAQIAARELGDTYHCYSPVDLSWVVSKFFRVLNPALLVLVELELWPNWLAEARKRGVPVLLANGRISEGSFRNYSRFAWLLRRAYRAISVWAMQDEAYAERARALMTDSPGEARVVVTGNLKYDAMRFEPEAERVRWFREAFRIGKDRLVLVCGSTHPGEHETLIPLLQRLDCRAVIVPRHPERYAAVREQLTRAGLPWRNRSELSPDHPAGADDVILLDTVGELAHVYALADVVFVGGSLIPHGGQNMAEPVALGKATVVGPHTHNFSATVRELRECGGLVEVADGIGLERELIRLLNDPAARENIGRAGQARLLASRGALEKHLTLIKELLAQATS
jgi:3-deoxy-D-manno-octulosonic-acid transferase